MKTVIQIFGDCESHVNVELKTSHELTEKEIEDARSTLEEAYGPIDLDSPAPSFFAFHKKINELDSKLADQLMSFSIVTL